jgi:hypothetical protein
MTTSAQIRRNQQNAKHSTGPRTIVGKKRSRFNAVKHACTSKLVLLPQEEPAAFNQRTTAFFEHFKPQSSYEVILTQDAVYCSWQLKRCREAQWARLREKAVTGAVDEQQRLEKEVTELSEELFRAPNERPTALPGGELPDAEAGKAFGRKVNAAGEAPPACVLRRLESNPFGVHWLLMEFDSLSAPLQRGEGWNGSERFRARRLLGIHPEGAYLNDDLTLLFQACQTLDPTAGSMVSELWNQVVSANDLPVLENQYQRLVGLKPAMDRETARQHLIGVVRLETDRLEEKAREHQMRDELRAELAPNLAKVDLSHEGLLMTRYEFAWQRLLNRKESELKKLVEARPQLGWGYRYESLPPSANWLVAECDEQDHQEDDPVHEQDACAGLNDDGEATVGGDLDEQAPAIVARGDETAGLGFAPVLRNEPKGVSLALEGRMDDAEGLLRNEPSEQKDDDGDEAAAAAPRAATTFRNEASAVLEGDSQAKTSDAPHGVLRNEPKDISGVVQKTIGVAGGSLRNEPAVISEPVAHARRNGDVDEVVRKECGVVRSLRCDKAPTLAMGGPGQLLRSGIGLRDAVRLGNRDGGDGGGSRRQRRRRKKAEEARAGAR